MPSSTHSKRYRTAFSPWRRPGMLAVHAKVKEVNMQVTTKAPNRDDFGWSGDESERVTYAVLLGRAHDGGLTAVLTELIQLPTKENGMLAVVKAEVKTATGVFMSFGAASPDSLPKAAAPHLIRVAETQAKALAFRDAGNFTQGYADDSGELAVHAAPVKREIEPTSPGAIPNTERDASRRPQAASHNRAPSRSQGAETITDAQRRYLYRVLAERAGIEGQAATDEICRRAGLEDVGLLTRADASRLIDEVKGEAP